MPDSFCHVWMISATHWPTPKHLPSTCNNSSFPSTALLYLWQATMSINIQRTHKLPLMGSSHAITKSNAQIISQQHATTQHLQRPPPCQQLSITFQQWTSSPITDGMSFHPLSAGTWFCHFSYLWSSVVTFISCQWLFHSSCNLGKVISVGAMLAYSYLWAPGAFLIHIYVQLDSVMSL